ncbi:molecular chaperone DnaJ [Leptospira perolatii]|uniref:Molecular chaperone DnaJ n=1 Tax=Leptospira perolatii TaxID=2023191 RepID=A0A2M9ZSM9_9LEPT|nr:DnaJ domain-containing protein [Leptospira perolatii]PJZ68090.1 molecular chaperone DnaJ [Leptospira perolatii]PJZ75076.1 molecular chaperone DnaJ [Leptospira perolatii]
MNRNFVDHYRILGIPPGAELELIKARFRKLAKVFHPDNPGTGSSEIFLKIIRSYQVLIQPEERKRFDHEFFEFQKASQASPSKNYFKIPASRIVFSTQAVEFAKRGLLKAGLRNRDRRKYSGIFHDIRIRVTEQELAGRIRAEIPLVVRVLCPNCRGSDLYCDSCGGKGTYKSFRYLRFGAEPGTLVPGKIYTIDLSGFRPDPFTHFKKQSLKVKIELCTVPEK